MSDLDLLPPLPNGPLEPEPLPDWRREELALKHWPDDHYSDWRADYADQVCISRFGEL